MRFGYCTLLVTITCVERCDASGPRFPSWNGWGGNNETPILHVRPLGHPIAIHVAKPPLSTVWTQSVRYRQSSETPSSGAGRRKGAAPPEPMAQPSSVVSAGPGRSARCPPGRSQPKLGCPGAGGSRRQPGRPSPRQARPRAGDARGACPAPNAAGVGNPVEGKSETQHRRP